MFTIASPYKPTIDQSKVITGLSESISKGSKDNCLLGVTGSGKTFVMANIIKQLQQPALIISHNKTLAGQLYQEIRDYFPQSAVSYFVSYYDFYQPEAYIPSTDTYIEKEAMINDLIDKMRLKATSNIMTRNDVIVIASVSCIYNIGSSEDYAQNILKIDFQTPLNNKTIGKRLIELQYDRSEFDFKRGMFRIRGESIDIYPAYEDICIHIEIDHTVVIDAYLFMPLTGQRVSKIDRNEPLIIYPAKHYLADLQAFKKVEQRIRDDLHIEYQDLKNKGKLIEAERLLKKVNYDLEMISEVGYVNGIENYSRYFDDRMPGEPPYTLLDYFWNRYHQNWMVIVDESHMTIPQIRGMYNGDRSRKQTLIDYGFRMKAAADNRPFTFDEFYTRVPKILYVSATPDQWELTKAKRNVYELLTRPTGIIDPEITIRPSSNQINDLISEIESSVAQGHKVLVTALTKRIAEDLTKYLTEKNFKTKYLHSDIKTLKRSEILQSLRRGEFDILVGINLLREGLDLPEIGLVAILDAENEGFLRSRTALIQTMGRAARNINGKVIIYADKMTNSINQAVSEISRRRQYQITNNIKHKITPRSIDKPIKLDIANANNDQKSQDNQIPSQIKDLDKIIPDSLTPHDLKKILKMLDREMKKQANELNFEMAIAIRDKIQQLKNHE